MELNIIFQRITNMQNRVDALRVHSGGIFDYATKHERLIEVQRELEEPNLWNNLEQAQILGRERATLEKVVQNIEQLDTGLSDSYDLLEEKLLSQMEFSRMFPGEMDAHSAFLDIQSGSGGTEAQDWAEMLLRMYLRWTEHRGFTTEIIEYSPGDVAGIKSTTVQVNGKYAYGWLRTETGDDEIDIDINSADLRIDVYRASGAGGQHVNRTESAVRITHLPTNTVVQCQNDRSQHKNKATAMKQLKAKLYELEMQQRQTEQQATFDSKADIGWGSQIRSYVLDKSYIKDLRTGIETSNTQAVLDGDLDKFIETSLKSGV